MTAEQRQYLKSAIDAHRRAALTEARDPKFRKPKDESRLRPLFAVVAFANLTVLMTLALMVEHLAR